MHKKDNLQEFDVEDVLILHDPQTKQVHILNQTAAAVWKNCDTRSVDDIKKLIEDGYEIKMGIELSEDIKKIIHDFVSKGLLVAECQGDSHRVESES